jgi:hypothetical protein
MGLNKDEAIKKINEAQEASEFEVFTGTEHTTYLDNFAKTEVEKRIGDEVGKIHTQYDDNVFEILGERKTGSEKTYNFIKRKLKELKDASGSTPQLQEQIKKLEDDLKNKSGDEQLKRDYEKLKGDYNSDKENWDKKTQEYIRSQEAMRVEIQLDAAAAKLQFKEEIPQSVRAILIDNAKAKLLPSGKIIEKELIFVDAEGATLRNKNNALNPYTAEELMKNELKDVLGEKTVITGTGVKPTLQKDKDGKDTITVSIPDSVKTKVNLSDHLMSLGLTQDSKEYQAAYEKYSEGLPLK